MNPWPGQRRAKLEAMKQLAHARECLDKHRETRDPIYVEMARVHVKTARNFHRNAWRGPKR